jgi:hypothetical protein
MMMIHQPRSLSVFFGTVLTVGSVAQSWFPAEAEWHFFHQYGAGSGIGYIRVVVEGDTMLQGVPAKKLVKTRTIADAAVPPYIPYTQSAGYTILTEEAGLVRIHDHTLAAFDTLWNMAAVPGDSWRFADWTDLWNCTTSSFTQVVDTGTLIIDDVPLRWLAVEQHHVIEELDPPFIWVAEDTVVERIGALNDYLFPHDRCAGMTDGNEGGPLRCYSDGEISYNAGVVGWYTYSSACDFLPTAVPEERSSRITIHPNPGRDHVWLEHGSPLSSEASIELIDVQGRSVSQTTMLSDPFRWELPEIVPGIYLIRIRSGVFSSTSKWVKE